MIINKTDISKYSFGQQFSDMNGKTSNTAVIGSYLCVIGGTCFLLGTVSFLFLTVHVGFETVLSQSIAVVAIGAGLIGLKKLKQTRDTTNTIVEENNLATSTKSTTTTIDTNTTVEKKDTNIPVDENKES